MRWLGLVGIMICAAACAPAGADARATGEALTPPASKSPGPHGDFAGAGAADIDPMALQPLFTEHLGQLTSTATNTILPLGMRGTDLGSSFERDGAVIFLFGDTMSVDPAVSDRDSVARAPLSLPANGMPALDWMKSGSRFLALDVAGVPLGTMNVPVEGVAAGPLSYVFFSTGFDFGSNTYTRSTLAHASGTNFGSLVLDHDVPTARFANVSVVTEGSDAFVFGSGDYRKSAVYLAKVPLASIGDRGAWRYLASGGAYVEGEENGAAVVDANCVGELSVRKHPSLGVYMMTYACGEPRGVHLRLATSPAGPWSAPQVIFDPGVTGYQRFMHAKESVAGHDDGLSAPGVEEDWGGEYAPYLVPRWFTTDAASGAIGIVYTLSSWNPYQVHLVRTWLGVPGTSFTKPARGVGLPKAAIANGDFETGLAGWHQTGDTFATFAGSDGASRVTSFTPTQGDGAIGTLYQDFTVDAETSELAFLIHGGDGRVTLTRGADVVRSSHARRNNDVETSVVWNVEEYRGETLRVTIEDSIAGPWGFVGARGFVLR